MNESRLGPWSYYDVYFINTPDGVRAAGTAVICLPIYAPDKNAHNDALDEFQRLQHSLSQTLSFAAQFAQPQEHSIKVWGERPNIHYLRQYAPPLELKPYVQQGTLRFSFMAVEPVCDFLVHVVKTPKVLYEIIRPDLIIVRDETNTYFSPFHTWDKEAEEEGWEHSAYDDAP